MQMRPVMLLSIFVLILCLLPDCSRSARAQSPPGSAVRKQPSAPEEAGGTAADAERYVTIDFHDVDITVFIKFFSELTGKNFVIDDRVRGSVTVISPAKISLSEAYKVFESVLEVHGFAAVQAGEVIKIIPSPEARTKKVETMLMEERSSPEDKVVTQIIPLQYADAAEVKRLFTPLVSKASVILDYPPTNMLIVTDVYSNITRLMEILQAIDVLSTGQKISVIAVEHGNAADIGKILGQVFQTQSRKGKGAAEKRLEIVADERTNSIVLLASEEDTARIGQLIALIDKPVPRGEEKIHVYYLENAIAEECLIQRRQGMGLGTGD